MKRFKIFVVMAILAANFAVLASTSTAAVSKPTKGKKGTIGGVDTCHCPDDSGECYCNGSIEQDN